MKASSNLNMQGIYCILEADSNSENPTSNRRNYAFKK